MQKWLALFLLMIAMLKMAIRNGTLRGTTYYDLSYKDVVFPQPNNEYTEQIRNPINI